jgi:hypothetical protein
MLSMASRQLLWGSMNGISIRRADRKALGERLDISPDEPAYTQKSGSAKAQAGGASRLLPGRKEQIPLILTDLCDVR